MKSFENCFSFKELEKSNQILSIMKKINTISLTNFLGIQIHD